MKETFDETLKCGTSENDTDRQLRKTTLMLSSTDNKTSAIELTTAIATAATKLTATEAETTKR